MKIEQDKRRFDFHAIGKEKRKASGLTQEQLAYIVDREQRTIMYSENAGQHPSLNTFYQMVTMFDVSVDQYFYPSKNSGSECRKRRKCNEHRPPFFAPCRGFRQAGQVGTNLQFLNRIFQIQIQNACWAVPKPRLICIVPMQAARLFQTLL